MTSVRASILIPTFEGEADLERLLPALQAQRCAGGFEILAIDSDSRDATRQLLRAHGIPVTRIERSEFGHGSTRNALARAAAGSLCVFLSQDALPAGPEFLEEILKPLEDPGVAGVQARILPHPDQDALTRRTALDLAEAGEELALGPDDIVFNNVASAIRRKDLMETPFPELPFGEDWAWASAARAKGRRLAFAPRAVVFHAHCYTPNEAFRRYEIDAAFRRQVLAEEVRPGWLSVLRGIAYEVRQDLRFVRDTGASYADLLRSPGLRAAQILGQFAGTRPWPFRPAPDFPREVLDKLAPRVGRPARSESTGAPSSR